MMSALAIAVDALEDVVALLPPGHDATHVERVSIAASGHVAADVTLVVLRGPQQGAWDDWSILDDVSIGLAPAFALEVAS